MEIFIYIIHILNSSKKMLKLFHLTFESFYFLTILSSIPYESLPLILHNYKEKKEDYFQDHHHLQDKFCKNFHFYVLLLNFFLNLYLKTNFRITIIQNNASYPYLYNLINQLQVQWLHHPQFHQLQDLQFHFDFIILIKNIYFPS